MGLILLYIGGNIVFFILFAIFTSISKSLVSGTDTSLIFDTLKNENKEYSYKKIGGIYYTLWPFGASIGSIIGGYLATVSLSFPILITFIPVLISTILTFFLKEPYYKKELN